jgi:hypothetical protein
MRDTAMRYRSCSLARLLLFTRTVYVQCAAFMATVTRPTRSAPQPPTHIQLGDVLARLQGYAVVHSSKLVDAADLCARLYVVSLLVP